MEEKRYCPALRIEILEGACWEYCFAGRGGSTDTAEELKKWIVKSKRYTSLDEFHKVCDSCKSNF